MPPRGRHVHEYVSYYWRGYPAAGMRRALAAGLWTSPISGISRTPIVMMQTPGRARRVPTQMCNWEHKLPLAFLAAHPGAHSALRANAQAPLTPWDVYVTLREFATCPALAADGFGGLPRGAAVGPQPSEAAAADPNVRGASGAEVPVRVRRGGRGVGEGLRDGGQRAPGNVRWGVALPVAIFL